MAKRVCQRATSASLPSAVLHDILAMIKSGRDAAALLVALPDETLSPELIALRALGAVINLPGHWPVVHIAKIPIQHARLAIAALPAFAGVYVDAGFTSLDWLDATLPAAIPLTLVVDPSVLGMLSAFAYVWGDRVTHAIVQGYVAQPDPIPDILRRCVNVRSVSLQDTTASNTATYMAALPTHYLHTLHVRAFDEGAVAASGIVAWLQGASATDLTLHCESVSGPMALASAIQACATLRSLSLLYARNVQEALVSSPGSLQHVTSLSVVDSTLDVGEVLRLQEARSHQGPLVYI